jgi:hypothetical protein
MLTTGGKQWRRYGTTTDSKLRYPGAFTMIVDGIAVLIVAALWLPCSRARRPAPLRLGTSVIFRLSFGWQV